MGATAGPESVHEQLFEYLRITTCMAKSTNPKAPYSCAAEFVLRHGEVYQPAKWTGQYPQGAPKCCFANALMLSQITGLPYVEGYAVAPSVPLPVMHGWNLDASGRVIDITWLNRGHAYVGIEFEYGRAVDSIWHGDGSVLDDWNRGYPLFQQPWHGEEKGRTWPELPEEMSKLIEMLA